MLEFLVKFGVIPGGIFGSKTPPCRSRQGDQPAMLHAENTGEPNGQGAPVDSRLIHLWHASVKEFFHRL
jgi:hypothetical protein